MNSALPVSRARFYSPVNRAPTSLTSGDVVLPDARVSHSSRQPHRPNAAKTVTPAPSPSSNPPHQLPHFASAGPPGLVVEHPQQMPLPLRHLSSSPNRSGAAGYARNAASITGGSCFSPSHRQQQPLDAACCARLLRDSALLRALNPLPQLALSRFTPAPHTTSPAPSHSSKRSRLTSCRC